MLAGRPEREADTVFPPAQILVGWKEFLDFPEWGLKRVRVKVDTGACTSALGVVNYHVQDNHPAGPLAHLELALYRRRPERLTLVQTPVVATVVVKDSGGRKEQRPVIEVQIRLGPVVKRIRMTITRRCAMCYPILLGRQALAGHFVVDVSQKFLHRAR
jgi:hypothetical protein